MSVAARKLLPPSPPATKLESHAASIVQVIARDEPSARMGLPEASSVPEAQQPLLQAATARLWQRHRFYLQGLALRWLRGDRVEAEDAVADVICKASAVLSDSRYVIVNERAWLTRIMHNRCIDIHRSRYAIQPLNTTHDASDETAEGGAPVDRSAEELMLNQELGEIIRQALAELPNGLRGPAMMRLVEDEPYASISKRFRITEANARKRIQQAREILRRRLEPYLNGGERQVRM